MPQRAAVVILLLRSKITTALMRVRNCSRSATLSLTFRASARPAFRRRVTTGRALADSFLIFFEEREVGALERGDYPPPTIRAVDRVIQRLHLHRHLLRTKPTTYLDLVNPTGQRRSPLGRNRTIDLKTRLARRILLRRRLTLRSRLTPLAGRTRCTHIFCRSTRRNILN